MREQRTVNRVPQIGDVVLSLRTGKHYIIHGYHEKAPGIVGFYKAHHISGHGIEYTFLPVSIRLLTASEKRVLTNKMRAGNYEVEMPVQPRPRRRARISA